MLFRSLGVSGWLRMSGSDGICDPITQEAHRLLPDGNPAPEPATRTPGGQPFIFIYNKVYNIIAIKSNNYILLVIKHYIIIKICKNTIYNYKRTLNNTLFCVFLAKCLVETNFISIFAIVKQKIIVLRLIFDIFTYCV